MKLIYMLTPEQLRAMRYRWKTRLIREKMSRLRTELALRLLITASVLFLAAVALAHVLRGGLC